jgi:hypothetical protein
MRFLKEPFVQFLVLGAIVFGVYNLSPASVELENERSIVIDATTQQWLYDTFVKQMSRKPTRTEMDAIVHAQVNQDIKAREAIAMGLDAQDTIIHRRLNQKFDFLFGDAAASLVPEDGVLEQWYEDHSETFYVPGRISFSHVWFNPDARGASLETDAASGLQQLRAGEAVSGDRFPFETSMSNASTHEIRAVFGLEFVEAISQLPMNEWSGPVRSGLGLHAVSVTDREKNRVEPFENVRDRVLEHWRDAENERLLEDILNRLRSSYTIDIDDAALEQWEYAP